ncbi:NAD(P)H-dependent oxidoreductase [Facklamia sp. DSM 111018]|uniref:NAD(P)H-dependent oxidoreductase n=1 Tax=Facklamia lactis TaxID=2749967 RepID=A0ABS0LP88_9LACT|nr:NAD(P)H-dependent oxidoreductase [Facklamia lactis]MBG9985975.1 NAD(P)H-dependent oxidoreductase [Facklamia lactis]
MKLVGIVGSNAEQSYNRQLLQFIERHFKSKFDFEVLEIKDVPMFDASNDQTGHPAIQYLNSKIQAANGVIIATPEHIRTTTPVLKSTIEWLSYKVNPFVNKPVYVVGASYYDQGTSRAQLHVRQILQAPGANAYVFPGNEFLLGEAKEKFDSEGNIIDPGTITFLESCIEKFLRYVELVTELEKPVADPEAEDLEARGKIATTIEDVDMHADNWIEQASMKVGAVEGNTYVKLSDGLLTVEQIDDLLKSMPFEISFADANNQFIYYNHNKSCEEMLAKRSLEQVGNSLGDCHPKATHQTVKWIISQLRSGLQDVIKVYDSSHGPDKFVVNTYQAVRNDIGEYLGINEYVQDILPLIDWYLQQSRQELVSGTDTLSGASVSSNADTTSSASRSNLEDSTGLEADAVSGASLKK